MRYSLDSDKITQELGWQPQTNFDQGMKETVNWYKDNKWWWEKLMDKDKEHI